MMLLFGKLTGAFLSQDSALALLLRSLRWTQYSAYRIVEHLLQALLRQR